jgi:predicted RNA-binding Zn-ribbon protein involved in translation (DUF1610 family)
VLRGTAKALEDGLTEAILQKEEDMKAWCPSSGEDVGRIIESPRTDEWHIECPTCGRRWAGGSTVLDDHNRSGGR